MDPRAAAFALLFLLMQVVATADQVVVDNKRSPQEKQPIQVRTFPNGLVIEDMSMGKPHGKKASPGRKVSVNYIGWLKKNGEIFDSNVGEAPFMFRLGVGEVIKGWDWGVNGMRVGDKRRLTIPPAMGFDLLLCNDAGLELAVGDRVIEQAYRASTILGGSYVLTVLTLNRFSFLISLLLAICAKNIP